MRSLVLGVFSFLILTSSSFADGLSIEEKLSLRVEEAKESEREQIQDKLSKYETQPEPQYVEYKNEPGDKTEVSSLLDQIEALKTKVVVTKRNTLATKSPRNRKVVGSKTYYSFKDGDIYEVHAGVNSVTDIVLGKGETLTTSPISGDTVRWTVGVVEGVRTHVMIKPLEEDIATNLILITDKRTYHFKLISKDFYMPAVSFNYPEENMRLIKSRLKRSQTEERLKIDPKQLEFNYEIDGDDYNWEPLRVFDDGEKTYIQMPHDLNTTEAPAFFILTDSGEPMLTNYRKKGDYYILDRMFKRAVLRVGVEDEVQITGPRYEKSFWEEIF